MNEINDYLKNNNINAVVSDRFVVGDILENYGNFPKEGEKIYEKISSNILNNYSDEYYEYSYTVYKYYIDKNNNPRLSQFSQSELNYSQNLNASHKVLELVNDLHNISWKY